MFAAAIIAALAVIGSEMNSHQSTLQGAGGPTVTIDQAQLPLPVQGSLGVSGTVAATQSGAWNVGITGTPNVNVTNPAIAPVLFLNVNDPGRIPYESYITLMTCGGDQVCDVQFGGVPGGDRLVVQHIAIAGTVNTASTLAFANVDDIGTPGLPGFATIAQFPVPVIAQTSGASVIVDQPVLIYFDAGHAPAVAVHLNSASAIISTARVTLIGYLLNCSIGPCAPVAHF
jgi:hypothetical protein